MSAERAVESIRRDEGGSEAVTPAGASRHAVLRVAMRDARALADHSSEAEAEELRDELERLLAWRALRCVGAMPLLGAAQRESLARERRVSEAALRMIDSIAAREAGRGNRLELAGFAACLADFSDSALSYDLLREFELLKPRPPRLPRAGDWEGRALVLEWAESVLRGRGGVTA